MEQIKWTDDKIEQHLKNLPSIRDRRSKQELFLKIQANVHYKQNKEKRIPTWSLPALATACALLLFGIFVPELLNNGGQMHHNKSADSGGMESKAVLDADSDKAEEGVSLKADNLDTTAYHSPLLESNLGADQDWVTVSYLDDQAQLVIPVSFVTDTAHYVEKVNEQLKKFDPSAAGLIESPLQRATITEEEETVIIDWPQGSIFESEEVLLKSLISLTFANEGQKAKAEFKSNGNPGYEFSLLESSKEMDLEVPGAPHYRYDAPSTDAFIVSLFSTGQTDLPKSLEAALEVMDDDQGSGLKPILPKDIKFAVEETGKKSVEVTFPDSFKLSAENKDDLMIIDAILLTAKSYGYDSVKFKNTGLESIGPYQLNDPIKGITGINFVN